LVEALHPIADAKGATVAQVAIAWVLSPGTDIVPLVGARRRDRLVEALPVTRLVLTEQDLAAIERAVSPHSVAGERYHPQGMAGPDGERDGGRTGV
jgi:aryl-alcohol dehydrogenase-like predicted oxidoreductase